MGAVTLKVKKAGTLNTKLIPVAFEDILRSYEAKWSGCARKWTLWLWTSVVHSHIRGNKITCWTDAIIVYNREEGTCAEGDIIRHIVRQINANLHHIVFDVNLTRLIKMKIVTVYFYIFSSKADLNVYWRHIISQFFT